MGAAMPTPSEPPQDKDTQLTYDIDTGASEPDESDNATEEAERHFSDET